MAAIGKTQELLKRSTEVTEHLKCDAMGVYTLKPPGSERVKLILQLNKY